MDKVGSMQEYMGNVSREKDIVRKDLFEKNDWKFPKLMSSTKP